LLVIGMPFVFPVSGNSIRDLILHCGPSTAASRRKQTSGVLQCGVAYGDTKGFQSLLLPA
jgi:hypothetical protein